MKRIGPKDVRAREMHDTTLYLDPIIFIVVLYFVFFFSIIFYFIIIQTLTRLKQLINSIFFLSILVSVGGRNRNERDIRNVQWGRGMS